MNYQNLEQEIKEYSNYFKYCDSINSKFSSFLKLFVQSGNKFISKSKKSLDEFCSEINKVEYFPSSLNKNINGYCDQVKLIIDKFQNVFSNVEKDIITKVNEFDKKYKTNYKASLNKLNELNNYLLDNKTKLEKTKNNYFDSCKSVQEHNKKYLLLKSKETPKEELSKLNDQIIKLKQTSETKKVYYRNEVTKLNDLLLSNENYYIDIIKWISKQEEERSEFFTNILLLLNNIVKHFNFESKDLIAKNEKYIDDIYTKRDIKMFNLYFNKTNNNKDKSRFLYEEFFDFENFNAPNSNIELKENNSKSQNNSEKAQKENEASEVLKLDYNLCLKISQMGKEKLINFDFKNKEYIELDNIISNLMLKDNKIEDDKFLRIMHLVEEKVDGCKNFIYILMNRYSQKHLIQFKCVENIYFLNSVLNLIINYLWENDEYTYLAFFILFIGERTIFINPKEKNNINYLCKIMATNTIYHISDFWNKIINLKIKMLARVKLNEEFKIRKKNTARKDSGLISKIFGISSDDNDQIENKILYSQIYKEKSSSYFDDVLNEYLNHFICYEFSENKTIDLIEELSKQYDLNIRHKNYCIKTIRTNLIYKKTPNPYFSEIKLEQKNSLKKYKKINNNKIKIILFCMKYLSNKDILSILCLNKEYYSIIKKYFYKNILINKNSKIDIKKHISIWKALLGYNKLKSKYNYKSLKESTIQDNKSVIEIVNNKNEFTNTDSKESEFDTIELDCVRTTFKSNQEENQTKLSHLLKVASKQIPSINYCQGMNHIAAFLLVLCEENEEETFYLLLSILLGTDYCKLIEKDLVMLNSFFYSFERLLNLMFPEMYNFFINNNINGGYYLSPWFITLFTLAFKNESEEENNIEVFAKIFDLYLFSGWKAVFKIGISLIRNNSSKIFSLPYEQLVHYLNNDIIHSDFFTNTHIEELYNIFTNFKISNNLLSNLNEEYEMKKNILNKNNNLI